MGILGIIQAFLFMFALPALFSGSPVLMLFSFVVTIAFALVGTFFYFAVFESMWGATPGKLFLCIRVINGDDGQLVSFWRTIVRNLSKLLSILTLGLGYLLAAFDSQKKALHDHVAGCLVVRSNNLSWGRIWAGVLLALALGVVSSRFSSTNSNTVQLNLSKFGKFGTTQQQPRSSSLSSSNYPSLPQSQAQPQVSASEMRPPAASSSQKQPGLPKEVRPPAESTARFATVDSQRLEFHSTVAVLDAETDILSVYFFTPRSLSIRDRVLRIHAKTATAAPDLSFELRFNGSYEVRSLSSYVIRFNENRQGFKLPVSGQSIEFARASTWGRNGELLGLSDEVIPGKEFSAFFTGEGRVWKDKTAVTFTWNVAASTTLLLAHAPQEGPREGN